MSRNLRIAHLPPTHPRLRFSGHLTDPRVTDAALTEALSPFLSNLKLYRAPSALPTDWPTRDDSNQQSKPPNVPVWGEGDDMSVASAIGDPETPWRLLVGQGQFVFDNVWLYDANADPWPAEIAPCPVCSLDDIKPPAQARSTGVSFLGLLIGAIAGGAAVGFVENRIRHRQ